MFAQHQSILLCSPAPVVPDAQRVRALCGDRGNDPCRGKEGGKCEFDSVGTVICKTSALLNAPPHIAYKPQATLAPGFASPRLLLRFGRQNWPSRAFLIKGEALPELNSCSLPCLAARVTPRQRQW